MVESSAPGVAVKDKIIHE